MNELRIDPTWSHQISAIRDANTDDTNLIRFDNGFYRVCRASPAPIKLTLRPTGSGEADAVPLTIDPRDFYVTMIGGQLMGRYSSTLGSKHINAPSLESAIRSVRSATGDNGFNLRSLLVFCVAESIRSDLIATKIESTIRASMGRLLGAASSIPVSSLLPQALAWGQSSDAVWAALSPQARQIYSKSITSRTTAERGFHETVNEAAVDAALVMTARGIKVLKRPV